jgi:hypothetical protein
MGLDKPNTRARAAQVTRDDRRDPNLSHAPGSARLSTGYVGGNPNRASVDSILTQKGATPPAIETGARPQTSNRTPCASGSFAE